MTASSSVEINCPKCRSASPMREGSVNDHGDGCRKMESVSVKSKPEESFWSGELKTKARLKFTVRAFCCANCSYPAFYTAESKASI